MDDLLSANSHRENLEYIDTPATQSAYIALLIGAERAGFQTSADGHGYMKGIEFRQDGKQPFALSRAKTHLTVYIRADALKQNPALRSLAATRFPDGFTSQTNTAGKDECSFRVCDVRDAEKAIALLFAT